MAAPDPLPEPGSDPESDLQPDPAQDPVLCSPFEEPDRHWQLDDLGRAVADTPPLLGRRDPLRIAMPADAGRSQPSLNLRDRSTNATVLALRREVGRWRDGGWRGATATTRRLLAHWAEPRESPPQLFFAQREAMETLIWLREVAPRSDPHRAALEAAARGRNDELVRLCAKMATGTGKTVVMGMLIAWQTLNAVGSLRTRNIQHTDRFAVFAPGLTVRDRLSELRPQAEKNVYDEMGLVPPEWRARLNQASVRIVNYQKFTQREQIEGRGARRVLAIADREKVESPAAMVRRVLDQLADGRAPICVINDEAHHCYLPQESARRRARADRDEDARAAVWFNALRTMRDMGLLGRVDKARGQECPVYDFSATPLWIDTARKSEPDQFEWVASDFGLMDAIESGLVKVPRVPIDDNGRRDETVWRRLWANTSQKKLTDWFADNPRRSDLPEHLHSAVSTVVEDWARRLDAWRDPSPDENGEARPPHPTPPVIIFVVNDIANAAAVWRWLAGHQSDDGSLVKGRFPELSNVDDQGHWYRSPRTLLVHSKVGGENEAPQKHLPKDFQDIVCATAGFSARKDTEKALRAMLNTVGKQGEPGAQVRCVVSVSMLTEGWDARTVTHIVGFRAFGAQLLCEQVTGRALRRTSYDAFRDEADVHGRQLLEPEYADVVGIPFEFMPGVDKPPKPPRPPKTPTRVHTVDGRGDLRVSWPQVLEYVRVAPPGRFTLNPRRVVPWTPARPEVPDEVRAAPAAGKTKQFEVAEYRRRTAILRLAGAVTETMSGANGDRSGFGRESLFRCAYAAVERWVSHPSVGVDNVGVLWRDPEQRRAARDAILDACDIDDSDDGRIERVARLAPTPILDTARVDFETTLENITETQRSELSHAACHSLLEKDTARVLDAHPRVVAWARNFQLGWAIPYWRPAGSQSGVGAWARYEPDFVARLDDGTNLIVECKGAYDDKANAAAEWTRDHWIRSVAATTALPDELRRWRYVVIDDPGAIRYQLDEGLDG